MSSETIPSFWFFILLICYFVSEIRFVFSYITPYLKISVMCVTAKVFLVLRAEFKSQ